METGPPGPISLMDMPPAGERFAGA